MHHDALEFPDGTFVLLTYLLSQNAWLAKEGPQAKRGNAPYRAGKYQVVTDEELIDGLSFPVHRRTHSRA